MAMRTLDWLPNTDENIGGWKEQHRSAIRVPMPNTERPMVRGIEAWINYAVAHQKRFESPIGEDYVCGLAWARWGFALRELLNCETGRLNCGTLDGILCHNLTEMGFTPEQGAP